MILRRAVIVAALTLATGPLHSLDPPIVTYDVAGIAGAPPLLTIFADGRTTFRDAHGHLQTSQLTATALGALVNDLTQLGVSQIDPAALQQTISARQIAMPADIGLTRLELSFPSGQTSITLVATALSAAQFPDIKDLQTVRAAERRLLTVLENLRKE